ncbi:hypothetical protein D3C84_1164550 [compost metagenome]
MHKLQRLAGNLGDALSDIGLSLLGVEAPHQEAGAHDRGVVVQDPGEGEVIEFNWL